jgi:hypothetical protein
LYSPSFDTVHSSGTSDVLPEGDVMVASTCASFTSTNAGSTTSALSFNGSPGSTRSMLVVMFTGAGTASTSQRMRRRQKVACVMSSTGTAASIFQSHES